MLNLVQRYVVVPIAASLLGCAAVAPASSSSDADSRLSDALQQALPSLVSSGDYRSASKLSFHLATTRSRLNETAAACSALSQSLAYYRTALSKETGEPVYAAASNGRTEDDGMQEIRSRFGCSVAQLATARSQMNETAAACSALSQSLAHYRTALSKETGEPVYAAASNGGTEYDGMQEIRTRFGCTVAQLS